MRIKLLFATVVLSACAQEFDAGDKSATTGGEVTATETDEGDGSQEDLLTFVQAYPASCDQRATRFNVDVRNALSYELLTNATCHFAFDDGTSADGCQPTHEFATSGDHTVVVTTTDPATGLTGSATVPFVVYEPLVSKLEVTTPECGLEVSWHATTNVATTFNVYVEPFDKIVADDLGSYGKVDGTVRLTEAGTFDVFMYSDVTVPGLGNCVSSTTTYFTVKECPCNH